MNDDFMKRGYLLPGEICVSDQMSIQQLATLLKQTPYQIVADLIELGVFARLEDHVEFGLITKVLRKYGFAAKKA